MRLRIAAGVRYEGRCGDAAVSDVKPQMRKPPNAAKLPGM